MNATSDIAELQQLVQATIHRWRAGERPDADALLKRHPALAQDKRLAVDLIYEEYCLRHEQGDSPAPSTFCDRFPHYQQSLSRMLEVHETLQGSTATPALAPKSPWPKIGEAFMGYQLVEALGRGSLARVFLAREAAVGNRLVVVKISRHGASEAHMLGKAAHPGIVPILSVKHDDHTGWTVICMPLLGTATGADLLKMVFPAGTPTTSAQVVAQVATQYCPAGVSRDSAAPQEALRWRGSYVDAIARWGLMLAEGLQAAHEAGVMHRDIKPSNVLLAWSGRPMLLDFNLSSDLTLLSHRVGGTLAYMAPELMTDLVHKSRGPARQFDPRSDLFSLGVLLYELLTGQLPAKPPGAEDLAPNDVEPWLAARGKEVTLPRQLNPQIDPALEAIVLRCLASDPSGRPATAAKLAGDLRGYLGWRLSGWRGLRRHRRGVLLTVLGAAALFVSGGVYWSRLPPQEERLLARGLQDYERGEYVAAADTFGECLQLKPGWPEAIFGRGQALRMSGEIDGARTEFQALQDYDIALSRSLAGYCALLMDSALVAERDYSLAVEKGADDPITWNNFGFSQKRQREFAAAGRSFNEAIAADPGLGVAWCNRALLGLDESMRSRQPVSQEALADIREACRLEPERPDFHFHAASILSVAMKGDGAFQFGPSFDPGIGSPLPNVGREPPKIDAELKGEALAHLKRAYELGYPPLSLRGVDPELAKEFKLPAAPSASKSDPVEKKPSPLIASPSQTAVLSDFLATSGG